MASQDNQVPVQDSTGGVVPTTGIMMSKTMSTSSLSSSVQPPELQVARSRSLSSQLGEAIWKSPLSPSPEGSAAITSILVRLESIELESRELLTQLFSMVQTDPRLERYIHRRLQDHRLSQMWELVEQILAAQQGTLDVDTILQQSDNSGGGYSSADHEDKEVKESNSGVTNERFHVREFDKDVPGEVKEPPPPPPSSSQN